MYIIKLTNEKTKEDYFIQKGEWSYWDLAYSDKNATRFSSVEEAAEVLKHEEFSKPNVFSDKSVSPPRILHCAAGLNNAVRQGAVKVSIVQITFTEVSSVRWEYAVDFKGVTETKL